MKSLSRIASILTLVTATLLTATPSIADDSIKNDGEEKSEDEFAQTDARIAWFGTWDTALREATRSQRPILLVSAAPFCHGVPGIW